MRRFRLLFAPITLCAALALSGCRDPQIASYSAPKDPAPAIQSPAPGAASVDNSTVPSLRWQTPTGWQEQSGNSVRLGSFLITGENDRRADVAITTFGGEVGGDLANVNRWRNQLELTPLTESALALTITHLDLPAGHFDLVDMTSERPLANASTGSSPPALTRTIAAWLKQPARTWFIKMSGDETLVGAQRETFLSFLRSLAFGPPAASTVSSASAPLPPMPGATPPTPANASANSGGGSMSGATLPSSAVSTGTALTWTAPADWTPKPLGAVRKGSFTVRGPDASAGDADLSITAFPGAVGGMLANLNRWRGELQLPPLTDADLATNTTVIPSTDGALQFTVVDFAGAPAGTPTRTIGALVPVGTDTYFFKLKGPDATVAHHKPAFLAFLQTVKTR